MTGEPKHTALELGIYSLYCRRQRDDLIETYKLLKGYYDIDWFKLFTLSSISHTRGHQVTTKNLNHSHQT